MNTCSICNELSAVQENNRLFKYNKVLKASIYDDSLFQIIPSIGALTVGHSLLVSKKHENSILKVCRENKVNLTKILETYCQSIEISDKESLLCFEHGSFCVSPNKELCSTTHAHLHLVPIENAILNKLYKELESQLTGIASFTREKALYEITVTSDYLLVFDYSDLQMRNVIAATTDNIPSQFMRKLIGNLTLNNHWDWKTNIDNELTNKTIKRYKYKIEPTFQLRE